MQDETISLADLFNLGVLGSSERHGYQIVSVADQWAVSRWAGISIGSIYHSLRKLLKVGYIETAKVEREGNRPERQVYRITNAGQSELIRLIERGLSSLSFEGREVDMALAFADRLPVETRRRRLQDRLGPLRERLAQLRHLDESYEACLTSDEPRLAEFKRLRHSAPWIYAGIRHGLVRLQAEEAWTHDLLNEIDLWPTPVSQSGYEKP